MNMFNGYLFTPQELDAHNEGIAGSFDTIERLLERIYIEKRISWTCPHCGTAEIVLDGLENIENFIEDRTKYCPDCEKIFEGIDAHEKRLDEQSARWMCESNP